MMKCHTNPNILFPRYKDDGLWWRGCSCWAWIRLPLFYGISLFFIIHFHTGLFQMLRVTILQLSLTLLSLWRMTPHVHPQPLQTSLIRTLTCSRDIFVVIYARFAGLQVVLHWLHSVITSIYYYIYIKILTNNPSLQIITHWVQHSHWTWTSTTEIYELWIWSALG